jgi:hypothetical protein
MRRLGISLVMACHDRMQTAGHCAESDCITQRKSEPRREEREGIRKGKPLVFFASVVTLRLVWVAGETVAFLRCRPIAVPSLGLFRVPALKHPRFRKGVG